MPARSVVINMKRNSVQYRVIHNVQFLLCLNQRNDFPQNCVRTIRMFSNCSIHTDKLFIPDRNDVWRKVL